MKPRVYFTVFIPARRRTNPFGDVSPATMIRVRGLCGDHRDAELMLRLQRGRRRQMECAR